VIRSNSDSREGLVDSEIGDEEGLLAEVTGITSSGMQHEVDVQAALEQDPSIAHAQMQNEDAPFENMSSEDTSSKLPGLHPDVQAALEKDPSTADAQKQF
jgi:hypothetical protein